MDVCVCIRCVSWVEEEEEEAAAVTIHSHSRIQTHTTTHATQIHARWKKVVGVEYLAGLHKEAQARCVDGGRDRKLEKNALAGPTQASNMPDIDPPPP